MSRKEKKSSSSSLGGSEARQIRAVPQEKKRASAAEKIPGFERFVFNFQLSLTLTKTSFDVKNRRGEAKDSEQKQKPYPQDGVVDGVIHRRQTKAENTKVC